MLRRLRASFPHAGPTENLDSRAAVGSFGVLAIRRARELFPELEFVLANAVQLPFADRVFDKAVAADFIEHIDDLTFRCMLAEVRRVLRPGGTLSLYTPNPRHLIERLKSHDILLADNPTHIGLRDATKLRRMLEEAGYDVDRDEWRPSFLPILQTIERLLGPRLDTFRYRLCMRVRTPATSPRLIGA